MTTTPFNPTAEQRAIIDHSGSAFVEACPGAGKTRTMVERARRLLERTENLRGVAFLSFTTAAVDDLESRLRAFGVLPTPLFPSFLGTFDRFLWQFLIAPFGIPECARHPRLIPDKSDWEVTPPYNTQSLTLRCFDRQSGRIIPANAKREGFDVTTRPSQGHERMALAVIKSSWSDGLIDFDDARAIARERLMDKAFAQRLGAALAARFLEIVIDEAQDCNPDDLDIVAWLRASGIVVKVICDPNQSIYEFRGGVTDELLKFADTFDKAQRLPMSGNFRSTPAICRSISTLRPPKSRGQIDTPLGVFKDDPTPTHILSYAGASVPAAIGTKFTTLVQGLGIALDRAPVLAATRGSGAHAIGQPVAPSTKNKTLLLADAVMGYHFSFAAGDRRKALADFHGVVLWVQGYIPSLGQYHRYVEEQGMGDGRWRTDAIALANELRFTPQETPAHWLKRVRKKLGPTLTGQGTVNQRLKDDSELANVLATPPLSSPSSRTIHSAKGLEFPAVCVVLTKNKAKSILNVLEGKSAGDLAIEEEARKIYVAASRAERLLAIALPTTQAPRLSGLLKAANAAFVVHQI